MEDDIELGPPLFTNIVGERQTFIAQFQEVVSLLLVLAILFALIWIFRAHVTRAYDPMLQFLRGLLRIFRVDKVAVRMRAVISYIMEKGKAP